MCPTENGTHNGEISEEADNDRNNTSSKHVDFVPIYIPTVENGHLDQICRKKRFLDFLKARPSKDWLLKFGFVRTLSRFSFSQRNSSQSIEPSLPSDTTPARVGRRLHMPFVRKINWRWLIRYSIKWIKDPANLAIFIWFLFVAVGVIIVGLLMLGLLDGLITSSAKRKEWMEVSNQILNALFMIMCLYQHPYLFHHLFMLCRWTSSDKVQIRKIYCKDGAQRPHERVQMMFVVILFHLTILAQYVMCVLYWGYSYDTRPELAVYIFSGLGLVLPVIAGVYIVISPLGKRYDNEPPMDQESQQEVATAGRQIHSDSSLKYRSIVVAEPNWIGGLFDCWDDVAVAYSSFFCTFCVHGWNMERLGFGNMYVHIFTFILLCIAPVLTFGASTLNIENNNIELVVRILGIVLCFFGLLYGGYWRTQIRKKFKLPGNPICCGYSLVTDCVQWLFCWSCSLAQEVRTGNFYDVEDDSFCKRLVDEDGHPALLSLTQEESRSMYILKLDPNLRSHSCPQEMGDVRPELLEDLSRDYFSLSFERSPMYSKVHAITPPLPLEIQGQDK